MRASWASTPIRATTNSSPPNRPDLVVGPHGPPQSVADLDEQGVARSMAEPVVHGLEAVEIDEPDPDAAAAVEGVGHPTFEPSAAGETGERVALDLTTKRLHPVAAVGDVAEDEHPSGNHGVGGEVVHDHVEPSAVRVAGLRRQQLHGDDRGGCRRSVAHAEAVGPEGQRQRPSHELRLRGAEHRSGERTHERDALGPVDDDGAVGHVLHEHTEQVLAGAELLLGSLAVADLAQVDDESGHVAVLACVAHHGLGPHRWLSAAPKTQLRPLQPSAAVGELTDELAHDGQVTAVDVPHCGTADEELRRAPEQVAESIAGMSDREIVGVEHGDRLVAVSHDRAPVRLGLPGSFEGMFAARYVAPRQPHGTVWRGADRLVLDEPPAVGAPPDAEDRQRPVVVGHRQQGVERVDVFGVQRRPVVVRAGTVGGDRDVGERRGGVGHSSSSPEGAIRASFGTPDPGHEALPRRDDHDVTSGHRELGRSAQGFALKLGREPPT